MKVKQILFIKCLFFVFDLYSATNFDSNYPDLFNTTSGLYKATKVKIKGYGYNKPVFVHKLLSVKYAEKPERFKDPVIKKYVNGLHEPKHSLACFQSVNLSSYGLFNIKEVPLMTEDCLVMNIYLPVPKDQNEVNINLPVVVHIHGGSNMVGGAGLFDGSYLASKGIIVAIINYRLSILGFLSDLTENYPGNYGLKDQIMAIKWIKQNCAVLRCNPNKITLWGHSAGAGDANLLALSASSRNYFQRIIIQSGSSFSYWGYDKAPFERYKALKKYFNCTYLPDEATYKNKAMTLLMSSCLSKVPIEKLFEFRFALIDAPGPTYDGFLKTNSIFSKHSLKEMIQNDDKLLKLDVLIGINSVEGFSFEGYFSNSVKFFTQNNFTNEVFLTLERFSLLSRDKCKQNTIIENRLKLDEYYTHRLSKNIANKNLIDSEEARRLKAIFANSDAIFDTGFIELLNHLVDKKRGQSNLFVYEYLHENSGSISNLENYKKILKNFSMSTHFDGIDLIFGLPIAYINMNLPIDKEYDYPFSNFIFESTFSREEADLSLALINYYANFIKEGNPNVGNKVNIKWESYLNDKTYLKLNTDLLYKNKTLHSKEIRKDLYDFWFVEMDKNANCSSFDTGSRNFYKSSVHTKGKDRALDRCLGLLNQSEEYNYLSDMFLIEYENCMSSLDPETPQLKNLFNTVCLDAIVVRRMLIEYEICCADNSTNIRSTLCDFKNFDKRFVGYSLKDLIEFTKKKAGFLNSATNVFKSFYNIFVILSINLLFTALLIFV